MSRLLPLLFLLGACPEYEFVQYEVVDVFFQEPPGKVDVLMVIDNSGSMEGWQLLLGMRFNEFLEGFTEAGVDYQIGITTTTVRETWSTPNCDQDDYDQVPAPGHLYGGDWITPETADADAAFRSLVHVGTCGSADERGLEAARLALSAELLIGGANSGFIRDDASLSIVFVSDEQDASPDPVWAYVNDFYEVKGQRTRDVFNASALVITDSEACPLTTAPANEGSRYAAVVAETGGVVGNLCNTDFEQIVREISLSASRLRDTYYLSDEPAPQTLVVSIDDREVPCSSGEYSFTRAIDPDGRERPAIIFDRNHLPQPDSQIAARFNVGNGAPDLWCPPEEEAQ